MTARPRFSILIPTLNEAANLPATLASVRAAFGKNAEIIVSDAGSADRTTQLAEAEGAHVVMGARGRGAQLDAALHFARGDICVLLHADTLVPGNAPELIEHALREPAAVGGAFLLQFADRALPWLARGINLRSRVFRSATGDQAMFARRSVLLEIGGVPHVALFEDVRLWKQLKRAGRVKLLRASVTTSARLWKQLGTLRGILLHLRLRALHALGVQPERLARMYPTGGS